VQRNGLYKPDGGDSEVKPFEKGWSRREEPVEDRGKGPLGSGGRKEGKTGGGKGNGRGFTIMRKLEPRRQR